MDQIVKSARRVLEVLEYFAQTQKAASADEVRRALGYPQSSTSMLLRSLALLGYLSFEPATRKFRPTIRIALLGAWLIDEAGQLRNPPAIMRRLSEATGDMIALGSQQGVEVVYVQVLQATNPVRFHMKLGAHRPLCSTAIGRALLSKKSDKEIGSIVRRVNAERNRNAAPLIPSQVIDAVREGRRLGYFVTRGTATPNAGVIAMPIGSAPDHPTLAIGIGVPLDRIDRDEMRFAALLREEVTRAEVGELSP